MCSEWEKTLLLSFKKPPSPLHCSGRSWVCVGKERRIFLWQPNVGLSVSRGRRNSGPPLHLSSLYRHDQDNELSRTNRKGGTRALSLGPVGGDPEVRSLVSDHSPRQGNRRGRTWRMCQLQVRPSNLVLPLKGSLPIWRLPIVSSKTCSSVVHVDES